MIRDGPAKIGCNWEDPEYGISQAGPNAGESIGLVVVLKGYEFYNILVSPESQDKGSKL
jgi:hypothetical protein